MLVKCGEVGGYLVGTVVYTRVCVGGGGGDWPFGFSATMQWHALTGSSSEKDGRGRGMV